MTMQKHLYLFTVSPVQTFIEQARKTHDLFAGSRILSELITQAMEEVKQRDERVKFTFPTLGQKSKPNRFIAIVTADDIQGFGNEIQKKINEYFVDTLGERVITLHPPAKAQLEDFLKTYWVAIPYDEIENYPTQIKQLERKMGAVKNVRYFNQFSEKGRKCSVNGEYNVQFYRLGENEQTNDRLYEKKLFQKRVEVKVVGANKFNELKQKDLNQGEGLCAISMLKRLYSKGEPDDGFPSTARVALMDTLEKCDETLAFFEFVKSLNGGSADEQIYYESNTTKSYFQKHGYLQLLEKCSNVDMFRKHFDKMRKEVKSKHLKLAKYYAILAFDADGMGEQLQKCENKEQHEAVSQLLADFAGKAEAYIDGNSFGKTVYAGGDDFLGFINLNHLFHVMETLRLEFNEVVNKGLEKEGYSHLKMTFSAGVAIAHYKTPLSEVLRWAKKMEKTAKKVLVKQNKSKAYQESIDKGKKDAFSVAVLKRSGEIHYTTWRWKVGDEWTTDLFYRLIRHLKKGDISKKFVTNLSSEYEKRLDKDGQWGKQAKDHGLENELNTMLQYELSYFMNRATANHDAVKGLSAALYKNYEDHLDFDLGVQNFLNMLHICEFITRELNPIKYETATEENSEQPQTENA